MTDYTQDELAMLTNEEREELERQPENERTSEPETTDENVAQAVAPSPDGQATETANMTNENADKAAQEPEGVEAQAPSQEGKEDEDEGASESGRQPPSQAAAVFPTFDAPEDAKARLSQIEEDLGKLGLQFEEGGMTAADYQRQMLQLMNEKIDLREQIFKASLSQEVHQKTWFEVTVPAFLEAHPQYRENQVLFDSLNLQVQRLQAENPDRSFSPDILAQAHSRLADVFDFGANKPQPAAALTSQPQPKPQPSREIPPNLGTVPASDMTGTADGGLFRHLDQLADENVEKYEEELARLSDAQREAYLKFG